MTRQIMQVGSLTVTALVGPQRRQLLEIDVAGDVPARLDRQQAKCLAAALQRWLEETE